MSVLYVLIIKNSGSVSFKTFSTPAELIGYVSNMSPADGKVSKIAGVDENGIATSMTISFDNGLLGLVYTAQ